MYRGSNLGSVDTGLPSRSNCPVLGSTVGLGLGLKSLILDGLIALESLESGLLLCISFDLAMAKSFIITCLEVKCCSAN